MSPMCGIYGRSIQKSSFSGAIYHLSMHVCVRPSVRPSMSGKNLVWQKLIARFFKFKDLRNGSTDFCNFNHTKYSDYTSVVILIIQNTVIILR